MVVRVDTASASAGWSTDWSKPTYQLLGIGILVEVLRRLGVAFVAVRTEERAA